MTQNLGKVGIVDKGIFDLNKIYNKCDFVYFKGSTWLALKDNLIGIEPTESENWKYLAKGFEAEFLNMITAIDTLGLLGTAGATTDTQTLIDFIANFVFEQEIEYITNGSILEICEKKKKSFRFIVYSDMGRYSSGFVTDMPNYGVRGNDNDDLWHGEFQWILPIVKGSGSYHSGIHCILRVKNLSGEEYVRTGWTLDDTGDGLRFIWDKWIQASGCSFKSYIDVHLLSNGKYFVINGINLPKGLWGGYVEVIKNNNIEEILCRCGANVYIKTKNIYNGEWGEWRCLSSDKTMPVYVGSIPPEDTNVLWVW